MRIFAVLGVLILGCNGSARDAVPDANPAPSAPEDEQEATSFPTDWVRVESSCGYGFRAPPDLMQRTVGNIDSCVDGWATRSCVYTGDYGGFSSDLEEYEHFPQYEESRELIDGQAAKVVTAMADEFLLAAANIPHVDGVLQGVGLTVWAECQDTAGRQDALSAFRTITFER
jgi:hypothetical protein